MLLLVFYTSLATAVISLVFGRITEGRLQFFRQGVPALRVDPLQLPHAQADKGGSSQQSR